MTLHNLGIDISLCYRFIHTQGGYYIRSRVIGVIRTPHSLSFPATHASVRRTYLTQPCIMDMISLFLHESTWRAWDLRNFLCDLACTCPCHHSPLPPLPFSPHLYRTSAPPCFSLCLCPLRGHRWAHTSAFTCHLLSCRKGICPMIMLQERRKHESV